MTTAAVLTTFKAAALGALAAAGRPAPGTAYVSEGEIAYDCCDALVVELVAATNIGPPTCPVVALTVAVHVLRCAAPLGESDLPKPGDIETVGLGLLADLDALVRLSSCDRGFTNASLPRSTGGDCAVLVAFFEIQP